MSRFRVASDVFAQFPDYLVVVLVVEGIDHRQAPQHVQASLAESIAQVRERYGTRDPKDLPAIAVWRQAFRTLGWSASTYQSSVEALLRRTLKGNPPPSINPVVDLVNAASLRFLVPIGAHDLDSAPDGIAVRPSAAGDLFLPLGGGEPEIPDPGEIVYVHGHEVRTRRWVWRQSRLGLVTADTRRVFIPIDAFREVTGEAAQHAAEWLAAQFERLFGATVRRDLVDRARPETALER